MHKICNKQIDTCMGPLFNFKAATKVNEYFFFIINLNFVY